MIRLRARHHPRLWFSSTKGMIKRNRRLSALIAIGVIIFLSVYAKTIFHLTKEFLTHSNFNFKLCKRFHQMTHAETKQSEIPRIIHQVFLNASYNRVEFFQKYEPYRQSWKTKNPDFKYILWNATMIEELINTTYSSISPLYQRYQDIWKARADIARYLVLHKMGGVYADIDIECRGRMSDLYNEMGDRKVALNYSYDPFGIANDFFVVSRHHEFMAHVIDGLQEADVFYFTPFVNNMFRTGPMYMLGRYLNYPHKNDIYFLQKSQIYVSTENQVKSWHGFDALIIAIIWTGMDSLQLISIILLIVFIVRLNKLIRIRRKLIIKSNKDVGFCKNNNFKITPIMEEDGN
ncbi:hypothetical protein ACF0H5_021197 [Mactra antiquata]